SFPNIRTPPREISLVKEISRELICRLPQPQQLEAIELILAFASEIVLSKNCAKVPKKKNQLLRRALAFDIEVRIQNSNYCVVVFKVERSGVNLR
ncbi:unnamed protein product, partial [Allacma fusca]